MQHFVEVSKYLRLAYQGKQHDDPYVAVVLPNENLVTHVGEVLEFKQSNKEELCLILLKDNQIFTRKESQVCEIALDSL